MRITIGRLLLPLALIVGFGLACNFSTANIKDLKISKDDAGKDEVSKVNPGDKFYMVTNISNNPGKVKIKYKITFDDVKGQKSGDVASAFHYDDKPLEVSGDGRAYLSMSMPTSGFANGKYKVEATMLNEKDEQKDTKSTTFEVTGYSDGTAPE
jgi:hypothetical protein